MIFGSPDEWRAGWRRAGTSKPSHPEDVMYRRFLPYLTIAAILACNAENSTQPPAPLPSSASPVISDGAHGGNPDFFFLNPTVPNPKNPPGFGDPFNGSLLPLVTICELNLPNINNDGAVLPETACKTTTQGTDPYYQEFQLTAANVDLVAEKYQVDWMVPVAAAVYYRIRVIVGTNELGYADVKTGPTPQALKGTDQDDLIPRIDGSDLPIKFRIEEFALCEGDGPCSSESVDLDDGGTVQTTFTGDVAPTGIEIQPNSGNTTHVVTIEECPSLNPRVTDLPSASKCARITLDPPLTQNFDVPAIMFFCSLAVEPPGAEQKRTVHRFDENGNGGTLTALRHVDPDACGPQITSSSASLKGMLADLVHGRLKSAGKQLIAVISPRPLYATMMLDEGGGGETEGASDFEILDPAKLTILAGNNQTGVPGALPTDLTVFVSTLNDEPVAGARITFTPANGSADPLVVVTGSNGLASTSWTIQEGANTLTASGRGIAGDDFNGPRGGVAVVDPFQPIQAPFDTDLTNETGPEGVEVKTGSVQFSATGVNPIRISGFDENRSRAPLITSEGDPGGLSSTLVAALNNSTNFGASGIVSCPVSFQPFVETIATSSLVSGGNRLVDVFFAGLTATTLTTAEATELAAFVNAGGILYVAGNSADNEGPSYNPLFTALGTATTYNASPTGSFFVEQSSDPPNTTPFTNGPFGPVGPLAHSIFRGIQPGSMTGLATGFGSAEYLVVEGSFTTGRVSAHGDPLYFNLFTDVDADNQNYFLNLVAAGCSVPPPILTRLRVPGR
jgi:hypothetical protein